MRADRARALTQLSDEERMLQESVRDFAGERIAPLVRQMDEAQTMDAGLIRELFGLGLMGIEVPEELGGAGGSFFDACLAIEAISEVDPAVGVMVDVQNTLCINALNKWGSDEQKKRYLPRMAKDTIGSYCLSEAASGSDAFALQTRATQRGSDYVLNGQKLWITNAKEAGLYLVFATLDPALGYKGITGFVVEKGTPGFSVGKKEDKLGIRASSTCELVFQDCVVGADQVLGEPGKGYKIAIETLNEGRIGIGAQMLGLASGAWGHAAKWAKERKQFGKALVEFQAMQFQLAEMATEIEMAKLMVYNAARLKDNGSEFLKEAAMCKYVASQVAEKTASLAVEVFGGSGFVKEFPVEKLYRDAKIGKIYEGTSFMQLATIAKLTLGKS
ncbi:acyl-CoA dehydrogenase [Granulicella tundricola]|uniref:short-chain 2-methylacyl-CoA dehydrogenase n=1 Tax=Granulicella tundricola (strain ATCC BAA-1859 / DSM 23138 / MP5ACTX9) TaxID=1198114 RepID=E8WY33_GRATM|nr:acyl-CoA dehydrogenase [Granulicella tundricola]ADW67572.1 acyl-CoA dehydrogenase domain-containing protein [Granulicella tundricola MP5ACTX9]